VIAIHANKSLISLLIRLLVVFIISLYFKFFNITKDLKKSTSISLSPKKTWKRLVAQQKKAIYTII